MSMSMRLTKEDEIRLKIIREYFASLKPVPLHLKDIEIIRIALRELVEKIHGIEKTHA